MRINKKRLRDEGLCLIAVIIGIALIVINFIYATPGTSGDMNKVLAFCISIAWTPGIMLIVGGIAEFLVVLDKEYPRSKKAR